MLNKWDELASDWDSDDDVQIYARKAFDSLTRKAALLVFDLPDSRILDFGCGTGILTEKLAKVCDELVAVDTSERMINVLREKVKEAGIENISPLLVAINAGTINEHAEFDRKFDLIVASSVCSFLPDYEATLGDLASMLNPGGYFMQWDWLAEMPVGRIQSAFDGAGLISHGIEDEFTMIAGEDSLPVVMGIGRMEG